MMSNVMAATYPDLIKAVSAYSGVAAGCYSSSSGAVAAWNSQCAQGQIIRTPAEWATIARNMYPGYTGARPRMQIWHGSADTTIYPQNFQEQIKQWTAIFGVSQTATQSQSNSPDPNYTRSDYGPNVQGIYAQGTGHSVLPHLADSERWFGLDGSQPPVSATSATSSTSSTFSTVTSQTPSSTTTSTPSATPTATAQRWGQCGGQNWTGPTVCASPYACQCQNQWYCQCL
jgi:acetylxylan esterase